MNTCVDNTNHSVRRMMGWSCPFLTDFVEQGTNFSVAQKVQSYFYPAARNNLWQLADFVEDRAWLNIYDLKEK